MTVIYPSLNKLWKTFKKVVKMSHFAFYRSKRCTPKKMHLTLIRSSGLGFRPPGKKKNANPQGYAQGGHGYKSNGTIH